MIILQYKKEKSFNSITQLSKEFFKETIHYINYRRIYNKKMRRRRRHIVKPFFVSYAIFLKQCNDIRLRINATSFVNDTNILMYKKFIKCNYKILN